MKVRPTCQTHIREIVPNGLYTYDVRMTLCGAIRAKIRTATRFSWIRGLDILQVLTGEVSLSPGNALTVMTGKYHWLIVLSWRWAGERDRTRRRARAQRRPLGCTSGSDQNRVQWDKSQVGSVGQVPLNPLGIADNASRKPLAEN